MVDKKTLNSAAHAGRLVRTAPEGSHPAIVKFSQKLVKELERRGIPFYVHEYTRTEERQAWLLTQRVTKAPPGSSPHQYGCAADIVHSARFWDLSKAEWAVVGTIGKEIARKMNLKVTWGGDFRSIYDPAHWELADWKDRKRHHLKALRTGDFEYLRADKRGRHALIDAWIDNERKAKIA